MILIVNNVYYLNRNDFLLIVGMDPAKSYRRTIVIHHRDEPSNSLIMDEKSFHQLLQLSTELSSNNGQVITALHEDEDAKNLEVGEYNVRVINPHGIIRFSKRLCLFMVDSTHFLI